MPVESLHPWIAQLGQRDWDLLKILLDKGALALVVASFGLFSAFWMERLRQAFTERQGLQARLSDAEKDRIRRLLVPRTELDISCKFYGPEFGKIIMDIHLRAENKGQTIRVFDSIKYRVYGTRCDMRPELYACRDGSNRMALKDFSVSETVRWAFTVEPGIKQVFPLTTVIDADLKYVIVKIEVLTKRASDPESSWIGEERFFPVHLQQLAGQSSLIGGRSGQASASA